MTVTRRGELIDTSASGACIGELALVDHGSRIGDGHGGYRSERSRTVATDFTASVREMPDLALAIMGTLARRLRAMDERMTP